jgi:hypothetical protein
MPDENLRKAGNAGVVLFGCLLILGVAAWSDPHAVVGAWLFIQHIVLIVWSPFFYVVTFRWL